MEKNFVNKVLGFDDIQKMPSVAQVGSDLSNSPTQDPSLTVFLKNGYRLISTKSALGSSIEAEAFDEECKKNSEVQYCSAEMHNPINGISRSKDNFSKKIQSPDGEQNTIPTTKDDFFNSLEKIIDDKQLYNFLQDRHKNVEVGVRRL